MITLSPIKNQATLTALADELKKKSQLEVKWAWEPFHRASFRALQYAHQNAVLLDVMTKWSKELSAPSAPASLIKKYGENLKCEIDGERQIMALDPARLIEQGVESFEKSIDWSQALPLKAQDLATWPPFKVKTTDPLPSFLTKAPKTLKTFQELGGVEQMQVLEILVGYTQSHSLLEFTML